MAAEVISLLTSTSKLERDEGAEKLRSSLKQILDSRKRLEVLEVVECHLDSCCNQPDVRWDLKQSYLLVKKIGLKYKKDSGSEFLHQYLHVTEQLLLDPEPRVRVAAAELIGELCRECGLSVYERFSPFLLAHIATTLASQVVSESGSECGGKIPCSGAVPTAQQQQRLQVAQEAAAAPYRLLETSLFCLRLAVEGCGSSFSTTRFDEQLVDLVGQAARHRSRFVREAAFHLIDSLVASSRPAGDAHNAIAMEDEEEDEDECSHMDLDIEEDACQEPAVDGAVKTQDPLERFSLPLCQLLASGLADPTENWAQVRLAALRATRSFLVYFSEEQREQFLPLLLPRICLNRYYLADGVRFCAQSTWLEVFRDQGRRMVARYLEDTVEYYTSAGQQVGSPAIREAACQCMAELANKLEGRMLAPHLTRLLSTLAACLYDQAWPVRDMACVAAGSFVRSCPEESREYLHLFRPAFIHNLRHPIATIRQGAAQALSDCVRAYGMEFLEPLTIEIRGGLSAVMDQPARESGDVLGKEEKALGQEQQQQPFLLVDPRLQQCADCCSDLSTESRPAEPWEVADGCLHLLTEISSIQGFESWVGSLLPLVAESGRQRHYDQHLNYGGSVCGCLARLSSTLNKRMLKASLEEFFDTIFYTLESGNSLSSHSAEICLHKIAEVIGPNILRGRIENYNPRYLSLYARLRPVNQPTPATQATAVNEMRSSLTILLANDGGGPDRQQQLRTAVAIPGSGRTSCAPSLGGTPT